MGFVYMDAVGNKFSQVGNIAGNKATNLGNMAGNKATNLGTATGLLEENPWIKYGKMLGIILIDNRNILIGSILCIVIR